MYVHIIFEIGKKLAQLMYIHVNILISNYK